MDARATKRNESRKNSRPAHLVDGRPFGRSAAGVGAARRARLLDQNAGGRRRRRAQEEGGRPRDRQVQRVRFARSNQSRRGGSESFGLAGDLPLPGCFSGGGGGLRRSRAPLVARHDFHRVVAAVVAANISWSPTIATWYRPLSPSVARFKERELSILDQKNARYLP